jgi:hypothetical protein
MEHRQRSCHATDSDEDKLESKLDKLDKLEDVRFAPEDSGHEVEGQRCVTAPVPAGACLQERACSAQAVAAQTNLLLY